MSTLSELVTQGRHELASIRERDRQQKHAKMQEEAQAISRAWEEVRAAVASVVPADILPHVVYQDPFQQPESGSLLAHFPATNPGQPFWIVINGFCPVKGMIRHDQAREGENPGRWVDHWAIKNPKDFGFSVPAIGTYTGDDGEMFVEVRYDPRFSGNITKFDGAENLAFENLALVLAMAEEYGPKLVQAQEKARIHNLELAKRVREVQQPAPPKLAADLEHIDDVLCNAEDGSKSDSAVIAVGLALVALVKRIDKMTSKDGAFLDVRTHTQEY